MITGGAGFVGYHLAKRLSEEPDSQITLVDNLSRGAHDEDFADVLTNPRVDFVQLDLTASESYSQLGAGYDEVYHLAALIGVRNVVDRPQDVVRINAMSMLHLLDWLVRDNSRARVVFSSTSEAYAWTLLFHELPIPTPEDVPLALTDMSNPRSSYAGSKIFGELALTQYAKAHGFEYAILRYHNVYGARMGWDHVIPELFERARAENGPLDVYSPDHTRAFCHVDDAVDATVRAMRTPAASGYTFNVGNDMEEYRIAELAANVVEVGGLAAREIVGRKAANDPIQRRCPDISRAREVLDYRPEVSLIEGLGRTLPWYERHPRPERP